MRQISVLAAALAIVVGQAEAHAQIGPALNFPGQCPTSGIQPTPLPIVRNVAGTTSAVVATLAAPANGATNYLYGYTISGVGSAAAVVPVTISGILNGSIVVQVPIPITPGGVVVSQSFGIGISANGANTAIVLTTTADATATAIDVGLYGCQY